MTDPNQYLGISVDTEDWYHHPAVSGAPFSKYESSVEFMKSWSGEYDMLTKPTDITLEMLSDLNVKATFFVVADVVENYPGLVKKISDSGHEIACHGLHHQCAIHPDSKKPLFLRSEYRDNVAKAKRILEDATGQTVDGFRAPNAYIAGWVLDTLDDLGFQYDSSVAKNSLYNKTDSSLEGVDTTPYFPAETSLLPGNEPRIAEFPWPYYDIKLAKLPAGGGPILRLAGHRVVNSGINQSLKRGPTTFYFHPIAMARKKFPSEANLRRRPTFRLGRGRRAERNIRRVLETFQENLIPMGDLYDMYLDRL